MQRLYLDNAATSFPKPPEVAAAMARYLSDVGASAGRGAYAEAVESASILARCRRSLCELFNGQQPEQFVFTLNCTDALNLAIKGLLDSAGDDAHAICTQTDHNSILRPINEAAARGRLTSTCVPIDPRSGLIDPDDIRKSITPRTKFIAFSHVSNVTGTIQDLAAISAIAREHDVPLIVDAAQSAGHLLIDVQAQQIDLLAAPGHKALLGPLGTGFLYVRPGMENRLRPLREGGTGSRSESPRQPTEMPDRFEPGSQNAVGIAGLAEGVAYVLSRGIEALQRHDRVLIGTFLDGIDGVEHLHCYGPISVAKRIGVFSVRIDGIEPHELSAILEGSYGILTRSGLHCAPGAHEALGTLETGGTTRLSFGAFTSPQDVGYAADALAQIATSIPSPVQTAAPTIVQQ